MGTFFEARVIDQKSYQLVVAELGKVSSGSAACLVELVNRAQAGLASETFQRWNAGLHEAEPVAQRWKRELLALSSKTPGADVALQLAKLVVPTCCMPDFQWFPHGERSPTLQRLGDRDGGLYRLLCDNDEWFDSLLATSKYAEYTYGEGMVVLERTQLSRLLRALAALTLEHCKKAPRPVSCREAHDRLRTMVERCLASEDETISISIC